MAEANRSYELAPAMYSGVDVNPFFESQAVEADEVTNPNQSIQAVVAARIERLTQAEGGASDNEVNRAV